MASSSLLLSVAATAPPAAPGASLSVTRPILLSGANGVDSAGIHPGDVVAIFGCDPVGRFTIVSAFMTGAARFLAVGRMPSRFEMARAFGAHVPPRRRSVLSCRSPAGQTLTQGQTSCVRMSSWRSLHV
jgi:threonine dehydrogenase-like Zn-dependent dehydrogenase